LSGFAHALPRPRFTQQLFDLTPQCIRLDRPDRAEIAGHPFPLQRAANIALVIGGVQQNLRQAQASPFGG
jgi:hypothetical protein